MYEGLDIWNNIGPGDAYGLGNISALSGAQRLWVSEEANPPNNIIKAKTILWLNGSPNTPIHKTGVNSGKHALGVLYEGNFGCTDDTAGANPDVNGNDSDGLPCTAPCANGYSVSNYDPAASFGDDSCITPVLQLGDFYEGGYIVQFNNGVDETNGGTVAINYTDALAQVAKWSTDVNDIGTNTSDGATNTINIVASDGSNAVAAWTADNFSQFGYSDWYLPALNELQLTSDSTGSLYSGLNINSSSFYWSSTETGFSPDTTAYTWSPAGNAASINAKNVFNSLIFFRKFQ